MGDTNSTLSVGRISEPAMFACYSLVNNSANFAILVTCIGLKAARKQNYWSPF